jgi:hypothetical protein
MSSLLFIQKIIYKPLSKGVLCWVEIEAFVLSILPLLFAILVILLSKGSKQRKTPRPIENVIAMRVKLTQKLKIESEGQI